jgi:hypothetical protein
MELSHTIWNTSDDCSINSITIGIKELDDLVGQTWLDKTPDEIWIDPHAWEHGADAVIAHEIGHTQGYDHTDGICDLMAPNTPPKSCGRIEIAGKIYQWYDI